MKVRVTVLPNDGLPIITRPRLAECGIVGGYCEFSYKGEETPLLLSVEVGGSGSEGVSGYVRLMVCEVVHVDLWE